MLEDQFWLQEERDIVEEEKLRARWFDEDQQNEEELKVSIVT